MLALAAEVALLFGMPVVGASPHRRVFLVVGPAAWAIVYGSLGLAAWSGSPWALLGLLGQGFNCTFGTAASLAAHSRATDGTRATAQGIVQLFQGLGAFAGTLMVGLAVAAFGLEDMAGWGRLWLAAALSATAAMVLTVYVLRRAGHGGGS